MNNDNTAVIAEKQLMTVTVPVTTIALPDGFPVENLFIAHEKNNTTYYYATTISNVNGVNYATFTNPHGFSDFTVTADSREGTIDFGEIGSKVYDLSNIDDKLPIPDAPGGKHLVNWIINGNTYTTLTDELLNSIAGKTLTAAANFEDNNSISGILCHLFSHTH